MNETLKEAKRLCREEGRLDEAAALVEGFLNKLPYEYDGGSLNPDALESLPERIQAQKLAIDILERKVKREKLGGENHQK